MEVHVYIPVLFLFLAAITGILMPFLGLVHPEALVPKNLLLFSAMIIIALVWNIFYYNGAKNEKVQELEMIIMFQPLLTILLAAVFIEKNINIHIFLAAIVASLALIFSHLRKMHFQMNGYTWGLVFAVIFMSIEILLQKLLLGIYSPAALYFFRTGILSIFFLIFFHPRISQISSGHLRLIFFSAATGVLQMVTKFYGFEIYGVIYTSLILILSPVLVYILSAIMLHERLRARTIVSVVVILACIVYATVLGK